MSYRAIVVNGYAYPDINEELLVQTAPMLTFLSAFTYGITQNGDLLLLDDADLVKTVLPYGVKPLMVLTAIGPNGVFDSELASKVFQNQAWQDQIIDEILANLKEKEMFGVDFDFEYVFAQDRDAYTAFIEKTRIRLNEEGYIVLAALSPKTSTDQKGLLYEGHDYAGVGQAANLVLLMTYEWGYTYGPPMPVAPINKVREVLDYGVTQIPPSKLLMGIPNYGYDFSLPYVKGESRAKSIGNEEALRLAERYGATILFDPVAQTPHFSYWDEQGIQHEVWFEDARSICAKLQLVWEYGLAGVSYWNLMRPFSANWEVLTEVFDVVKVP